MINIKRFFDKVSHLEGKNTKDLILPISEAKMLRDEIAKLLIDLNEQNNKSKEKDDIIKIDIVGKKFK